jgi:hypothetical protein
MQTGPCQRSQHRVTDKCRCAAFGGWPLGFLHALRCRLSGEVSRLEQAGFATSEPTQAATVKVMMIKDPDGNSIALAETSDSASAQ